jgi:hypothetical protein
MRARLLLLSALVLLLAACGDDRRSMTITAAEGGTVIASSHEIMIPPASLAADTAVMLSRGDTADYPAIPGDRGVVLKVDPEGTVLELAATVTIHGSEIGASAEESVGVFQLVDGGWSPLEHTRDTETGDVSTSVTVFAPIGIGITAPGEGGTIEGTIAWGDGTPVDMAPIELYLGDTLVDSTQSGADGSYRFEALEPGTYSIRVDYECTIDQAVGVATGMTVTQDLTLCG